MRLQAEQAGPGGGAENGFHLRGAARARAASGGGEDQPPGSSVLRLSDVGRQQDNRLSVVLYPFEVQ